VIISHSRKPSSMGYAKSKASKADCFLLQHTELSGCFKAALKQAIEARAIPMFENLVISIMAVADNS